jgi:hypothetical protein
MCKQSLACGPQGLFTNDHTARLFRVPSARYLVTERRVARLAARNFLLKAPLARFLEIARRGPGRRGAPHAVDADINALVEFGRIVFRGALGNTRALCVCEFRLLRARGCNYRHCNYDAACAKTRLVLARQRLASEADNLEAGTASNLGTVGGP